jgi:hypothetical protein
MQYSIYNGAMQTTSAAAKVTTGTSAKTMMQLKSTIPFRIFEWGYSFDGSAAATPGEVELIEAGTVFATVTAYATSDITRYDGEALLFGDPTASSVIFTVGTSASGYTSSSEGSIVAVRNLAGPQLTAPTNQFIQQFPLGYRPFVQAAYSARIRMTFGTAVNAYCYMIIEV